MCLGGGGGVKESSGNVHAARYTGWCSWLLIIYQLFFQKKFKAESLNVPYPKYINFDRGTKKF